MSEYAFVEKPFLDQLQNLGWEVLDQGSGIPVDPSKSCRTSFREVTLKETFKKSVSRINTTEEGKEWLTEAQLEELYDELTNQKGKTLLEANKNVLERIFKSVVDKNELTGDAYPVVKIIDFDEPNRNSFTAINQFRIDTPGKGKGHIRPDIVLFVNGLPLVVVECKESNEFTSNPMHEAITQLLRYSNQRIETHEAGLKEGEERLFHFNQLMIATYGEDARFGTITSTPEYYFNWKAILPEEYQQYSPPLGTERLQEILIQGMLVPSTLLDIVRHFIIFMTIGKRIVKIVSHYQQYRAVTKIIKRLHEGKTPKDRSGVVWHTQGSGKSLTMVFLIRKIRTSEELKDYKVLMVNDRIDLEDQLSDTAALTGEKVYFVTSSDGLKNELISTISNLTMVMIHKFKSPDDKHTPFIVRETLEKWGIKKPAKANLFGMVNESEKILILVDEAHRTQSSMLGDNLFEAFPNATRIAFTGTPLITDRHTKKTWQRFGAYIDKYKLEDAVNDGVTVQILYEGKTADTAITEKHQFDTKFENLFKELSPKEMNIIKKKYGVTGDLLEAEKRIEAIAQDLVGHYVENILPNGFKAQVVTNSKLAAVRYQKAIDKALQERVEKERRTNPVNEELIKQIVFLKSAVVISSDKTNELAVITEARKTAEEINAIDNFKKKLDYNEPNTGIAFLVVCDMLLTGFDAPLEQVMYIDKRVKEHNLLQTIARVNRVSPGKSRGYIVDYIGLAHHLKEALAIYSEEDRADVENSLKSIATEVPILENRYQRLLQLFMDNGVEEIQNFVEQKINDPKKEYTVVEQAVDMLQNIKLRADFEVYFKKFIMSMDIILPHSSATPYKIPVKRFGYLFAAVRQRYKDESLQIQDAANKVKRLINEHLISLGINPKIPPVELISPNFIKQLNSNQSSRAKASEMEHAIRKHCKVHLDEDPILFKKMSEKLELLIKQYNQNWDELVKELTGLRDEILEGRKTDENGMDVISAPFYDLIKHTAFGESEIKADITNSLKIITMQLLVKIRETIPMINFWNNGFEINKLKGDLSDIVLLSDIDEVLDNSEKIVNEITALAKVRHKDLV